MTLAPSQLWIPKLVVITLGIVSAVSGVQAQDRGACVVAHVPEAYVLPDGSEHAAGALSLCLTQALTPVTGIHRVAVDGHALGMARSRRSLAEDRNIADPVVLFRRIGGGSLELVGYAVPIGGRVWSYALENTDEIARTRHFLADPSATETIAVLAQRN